MRPHSYRSWMVVALAATLGCQTPAPQFTAQDEAAVRAVFDSALAHLRAGDWTAWAALFSDSAVLQPPNGPTVSGRTALEAWGRGFPAIESVSWPDVQVHGEGQLAYGTSRYVLKLAGLPADSGKQLGVFRRTPDGRWEGVAVSFNSDVPLPAPTPSRR